MCRALEPGDRHALLVLARTTLEQHFAGVASVKDDPPPGVLAEPRGAFVTLTLDGQLRGCIGHVEGAQPLWWTVRDNALAAAFRDPRFPPLSEEELGRVHIEISALTRLTPVESTDDIEVGRHGLLIEKGPSRGLLLPQVPVEWGWDRDTFLAHTCRKAGLERDAWRHPDATLLKFEADVFGED